MLTQAPRPESHREQQQQQQQQQPECKSKKQAAGLCCFYRANQQRGVQGAARRGSEKTDSTAARDSRQFGLGEWPEVDRVACELEKARGDKKTALLARLEELSSSTDANAARYAKYTLGLHN